MSFLVPYLIGARVPKVVGMIENSVGLEVSIDSLDMVQVRPSDSSMLYQ